MRKHILAVIGVCIAWLAILLIAYYLPPISKPVSLTAAYWGRVATQIRMLVGTPMSARAFQERETAAVSTRAAIALTYAPWLATPVTPDAAQLTATRIVSELAPTLITATASRAQGARTTAIIQAVYPIIVETVTPDFSQVTCVPVLETHYQTGMMNEIETSLINATLSNPRVRVATGSIYQPLACGEQLIPLQTRFSIAVELNSVNDLGNRQTLANLTARILSALTRFPTQPAYGPEPATLMIVFQYRIWYVTVESPYAYALAIHEAGLRGEVLLEALGGILPGQ